MNFKQYPFSRIILIIENIFKIDEFKAKKKMFKFSNIYLVRGKKGST